jgi:hypothetical protein
MTTEVTAYCIALCIAALAMGVQLGALWGARVTRSESSKREQSAYDEGYDDSTSRKPRRWVR